MQWKVICLVFAICVSQTNQQLFPDRTCPLRSSRDSSGVCRCNSESEIFHEKEWICCPSNSSPGSHSCVCHNEKDYFDHLNGICITKLYLPSTTPVVPITYNYSNYKPVLCPNDPEHYVPYCNFTIVVTPCPEGKVGSYPYCYDPCPEYQSSKT